MHCIADKFPSSGFFDLMHSALTSSEADKKQAIDMGKGIYAITLKNEAGETDSWHIDLKTKGAVGKGVGDKPDGMCSCRQPKRGRSDPYLSIPTRRTQ